LNEAGQNLLESEMLSVHREVCRWQRIRNTPDEEKAERLDNELVKFCNMLFEAGEPCSTCAD
jgi:hypothetical protein